MASVCGLSPSLAGRISPPYERPNMRIVLIGTNVLENSRVGNTILGTTAFQSEASSSVKISGLVEERNLTVIRTSHLLQPNLTHNQLTQRVSECVSLSAPGPHVILVVLQYRDFTEFDRHRLKYVLNLFSKQAINHTIVLTTDEETRFSRVTSIIMNNFVHSLIKECGGGHLQFKETPGWRSELFRKIQEILEDIQDEFLICDLYEDRVDKSSVDGDPIRSGGSATDDRKLKESTNTGGEGGVFTSGKAKLNVVLCGNNTTLKSYVSKLIRGTWNKPMSKHEKASRECVKRDGKINGRQISVIELPVLTRLSEQEVMRQIHHCLSLCDPGVNLFILVAPVTPLTNEDEAEMEKINRIFNSKEHLMVLFITDRTVDQSVSEFVSSPESQRIVSLYGSWYSVMGLKDHNNSETVLKILNAIGQVKTEPYSLQMFLSAPERRIRHDLEQKLSVRENQIKELQQKINTLDSRDREDELRIVLLGKTGVGKSSTGNTILGREAFFADSACESVTKACQKESNELKGRLITVIDTPGLFDTELTNEEIKREISHCISMILPGPHVFLLLITLGRFTNEEQEMVKIIQENFGENSLTYTIVLFTRGDYLKNKTIDQLLKMVGSASKNLIETCGNRVHVFNNNQTGDRTQVSELLEKIDNMVKTNGGSYYSCKMFREMEREIQEQKEKIMMEEVERLKREREELMKKHKEETERMMEEERQKHDKERKRREEEFSEREERYKRDIKEREKEEKKIQENMKREKEKWEKQRQQERQKREEEEDKWTQKLKQEKDLQLKYEEKIKIMEEQIQNHDKERKIKEEEYNRDIEEVEKIKRKMEEELNREREQWEKKRKEEIKKREEEDERKRNKEQKMWDKYNHRLKEEKERMMMMMEEERQNHEKERKRREEEFIEREGRYKTEMRREREEWEKQKQQERRRRGEDEERRRNKEQEMSDEYYQRLKKEKEKMMMLIEEERQNHETDRKRREEEFREREEQYKTDMKREREEWERQKQQDRQRREEDERRRKIEQETWNECYQKLKQERDLQFKHEEKEIIKRMMEEDRQKHEKERKKREEENTEREEQYNRDIKEIEEHQKMIREEMKREREEWEKQRQQEREAEKVEKERHKSNQLYQETPAVLLPNNDEDSPSDPECLRILLFGRTGTGKSATGNTILGRNEFLSEASTDSVTIVCQKGAGEINGRSVAVVDTPDLFDTTLTNEQVVEEIVKCVSLSAPGPHVFIIVLSVGRITQEEKDTLDMIKMIFGQKAEKFSIVLFTRGESLKKHTIQQYVEKSKNNELKKLISDCGNRFLAFNNTNTEDRTQVTRLVNMIKEVIQSNEDQYFSNEMLKEAAISTEERKKILEENERRNQAEAEELEARYEREIKCMIERLKEMKQKTEEEKKILEMKFRERAETLRREFEEKEKSEQKKREEEDQKLSELEKQLRDEHEEKLEEMKKEIEDQRSEYEKQQREREEEERMREEKYKEDQEKMEKEHEHIIAELRKEEEQNKKRKLEEEMWKKQEEETRKEWRRKIEEADNDKKEVIEEQQREWEEEKKREMREREEEERKREEKQLREKQEELEKMKEKYEREREEERQMMMEERQKQRCEKEQRESEYKEKINIMEQLERERKEECERREREDEERREEKRKRWRKMIEDLKREQEEEIRRREREERERIEGEEKECNGMKQKHEEEIKAMNKKHEDEARKREEELNDFRKRKEQHIQELKERLGEIQLNKVERLRKVLMQKSFSSGRMFLKHDETT